MTVGEQGKVMETPEQTVPMNDNNSSDGIVEKAGSRLYQKGKEKLEKFETKRSETPEGCTFRPSVNKKTQWSAKVATPEGKDRFNRLYENAKQSAKKQAEERRKSSNPQYSFKPEITAKASRRISTGVTTPDRLYRDAMKIKDKKEQERLKRETEGCTFKPKINEKGSESRRRTPLYNAQAVRERNETLKQKKLEQEVEGCTFQPKISSRLSTPEKAKKTAVHDRLLETEARRVAKLEKLRQERALKEKEATPFAPKTSAGRKKSSDGNLYDRLYRSGNKADRVTELERKKMEEELAKCSFKPKISKSVTGKGKPAASESIFDRLYKESTKKLAVVEQREQQRLELEVRDCTFAPKVDTNVPETSRVEHSKVRPPPAPEQPIWERLHANDQNTKQEQEVGYHAGPL